MIRYVTPVMLGLLLSVPGTLCRASGEDMVLIRADEGWFYIDRTEVTAGALREFDPSYVPNEYFDDANMPATGITFYKAREYCKARGKRLPTWKEWQPVCLGPENLLYSYGSRYDPVKARVGRRIWTDGPKAVGSYEPNAYGVYDMVGNVWEWVDEGEGEMTSVCGGSWTNGPNRARCTVRLQADPEQPVMNYGFRCARSVTEAEQSRILGAEAAKLRALQEVERRKAEARQAAVEAAKRAKAEAGAQKILDAEEADRQAREAETVRRAEAFARKVANMVPVSVGASKFHIDRHEVTVAEYRAFDHTYRPDEMSPGDRMPATGVTFEQAQAFCRSLGKRLPTSKEWVAACLGDKGDLYSYGPQHDPSRGRTDLPWYAGADTVGVGDPSNCGATDLVGNVWEWVDGWYDEGRTLRALYGGAWADGPDWAKCTGAMWARPGARRADAGFRCATDKE